jgi:hypothetical protein
MDVGPHNSNLRDQFKSGKEKHRDRKEKRRQKTVDLTDKQAVINYLEGGNSPVSFVENNWQVWKKLLKKEPENRDDFIDEKFSGQKHGEISIMSKTLKRLEKFNNQDSAN